MALIRVYEPATRIGLLELDGLLSLLRTRADEMYANGEAGIELFEGAYTALEIVRSSGRIEYPGEFVAMFENYLKERGLM